MNKKKKAIKRRYKKEITGTLNKKYCFRCGKKLTKVNLAFLTYDPYTGKGVYTLDLSCPENLPTHGKSYSATFTKKELKILGKWKKVEK